MSDLDELITQAQTAKKTLDGFYAATKAIEKKRQAATREYEALCRNIHAAVGPLKERTLTTNLSRSRYYEIVTCTADTYYVRPVMRTGKPGKEGGDYTRKVKFVGSLLPVTDESDPVYTKWQRNKICNTLEGKEAGLEWL